MNTPHPDPVKADSQCAKVLARLRQSPGEPVGLWDLYEVSGSMAIHSRIADLRKRGHNITCETRHQGKRCISEYTLHEPVAVS